MRKTEQGTRTRPEVREGLSVAEQISALPVATLTHMKLIPPQRGCPNLCAMCSQEAGTVQFRLTPMGLDSLFNGIKGAVAMHAKEGRVIQLAGGRKDGHRKGELQPYYDNDVGSYPWLDRLIDHASDLDTQVAISTVGWSRHNKALQAMHTRINKEQRDKVSGVRFSWTPYTYGWTEAAQKSGDFSREEMVQDLANALRIYKPMAESLGTGAHKMRTEIRFRSLVESTENDLVDTFIEGHHIIQSGPYLLISKEETGAVPPIAKIKEITAKETTFTEEPTSYIMVSSDEQVRDDNWKTTAKKVIAGLAIETGDELNLDLGENASVTTVKLYSWQNADGPYYAVDPGPNEQTGEFNAKQFFPKTEKRKKSGYTDTQRHFLNALLAYKRKHGLEATDEFSEATWDDVSGVIADLDKKVSELSKFDLHAAEYVDTEVIPLVRGYSRALELADYHPSQFFSEDFTKDTGSNANQGRAKGDFHGLAVTTDTPMSPWEDRYFGGNSIVTSRENMWKWAPNPVSPSLTRLRSVEIGTKDSSSTLTRLTDSVTVSEIHPQTFASVTPDGQQLPHHVLTGIEVEAVTLADSKSNYLQPGLLKRAA